MVSSKQKKTAVLSLAMQKGSLGLETIMGTILEFRASTAKSQRPARRRRRIRRSAEIVIFPGVRYERWTEAQAPQATALAHAQQDKRQLGD